MKIENIQTISGPNIFHHRPVMVLLLDLGELADSASNETPGFNDLLLSYLPGLREHRCSPGYVGGFVERLERGTFLAHIIEHIALELSHLTGHEVNYGKTVSAGPKGLYRVAVRYKCEFTMRYLLGEAVALAEAVVAGKNGFPLSEKIEIAKEIASANALGPSTLAIVEAANKRNIPWVRLNEHNLIQFGYGRERRLIQATTTCSTSDIAVDIAQDKDLTKLMLRNVSIRVPRGRIVKDEQDAIRAFVDIGGKVALKPLDGHQGQGVSLGISTAEEVRLAYRYANRFSSSVIVEEQLEGRDYRVLVIGGKMVAAAERTPAYVIGNGTHSVAELVSAENLSPLRGTGHEKPLTYISLDDKVEKFLARQALCLQHVPEVGKKIFLRETANLSTGGTAADVTDLVHAEIRFLCERAARVVGLDVCGIDLIAHDISKPTAGQDVAIIEVNAGPGIRMHHFPTQGKGRDVGTAIMNTMYPPGRTGRIPIASITGTNGKTTVARLTAHILSSTGKTIGLTTTDGIFIGSHTVALGDTTGPASARAVLFDPEVEIAVLETARGGIVKRGLGYDWSDVGLITNIQADHIGQDGIESVEDIYRIKSLIAERVRKDGTVILNAEDEFTSRILEKLKSESISRSIVLFSTNCNASLLLTHIKQGLPAFFLKDGTLIEFREGEEHTLLRAEEVPISFFGTARFQVANALAATAVCRAMHINRETVALGLRSFRSTVHNSGRGNVYRVGRGLVMVDYGHNPDAFRAVGAMAERWPGLKVTGVVGVPGDRSDEIIRESGRAAASVFARIIVREDQDLRGRRTGEVAELLCAAIQKTNASCACQAIHDSREAIEYALLELGENELAVIFYEDLAATEEVLKRFNAQPFESVSPSLFGELVALREVG